MKCSINLYLIIFILIFFTFKNYKKKDNIENFASETNFKSGKNIQAFKYYKTSQSGNHCEDTLIGSLPDTVANIENQHTMNAQDYNTVHSGPLTIVHPESDSFTGTSKCRSQYAIYLDERFPEKPYAALNSTEYKDNTPNKPIAPSLNYKKNIPEKNKLNDYIVVPVPNVSKDGETYNLEEPSYVLLRYKDKPISTNWKQGDTQHTGYCNNYITCQQNFKDIQNPKCFDLDIYFDSTKNEYKYFQNGTQVV